MLLYIYIVYFLFQILVKYILKVTTQKSFISCTHTIKIIMCHERNQMSMMQLFNFSIMELLIKNYCFLYLADIIHLSYSTIDVFPLFASILQFIYLFIVTITSFTFAIHNLYSTSHLFSQLS